MCILLPILCFCCLFRLIWKRESGWFAAYLRATLLLVLYTVLSTEVLSASQAITDIHIRSGWALLALVLLIQLYRKRTVIRPLIGQIDVGQLPAALVLITLVWLLPLLFLTLYCAPNNQDGLSYHLVRIQHWIQNKNVGYYPTNFTVQNYYNVLSEYIILHSQLLSGSDYFMNAVQYVAMLNSCLTAFWVARQLGASRQGQWLSAVLVLTLPMGILQSTTTQNDYVTGFFTLSTVYWGLHLLKADSADKTRLIYLGLSIALGGFTKYSFFLIAFPFVAWFGGTCIHKWGWVAGFRVTLVCALVLLVIYSPFWYRNYQVLGSILSPTSTSTLFLDNYTNDRLTPQIVLSNMSKNLAMHVALPSQVHNDALLLAMNRLHQWLGVDISDPATTMGAYKLTFTINEDTSTNYVHLLLAVLAGLIAILRPVPSIIRVYCLCLIGSLLIYSAGFKWQYFHSRTQLPLFLLTAPFTAQVLTALLKNRRYWLNVLVVSLLIMSLPYVYSNTGKSIIPVRSLAKQITGYSPLSVSLANFPARHSQQQITSQLAQIGYRQNALSPDWYDREPNKNPAYSSLKALGYVPPREPTIWTVDNRQDFFFLVAGSQKAEWRDIMGILKNGNHSSVGLMIEGPDLIYPIWPMMREAFTETPRIEYVYFPAVLNQLANNHSEKPYTCIISNLGYTRDVLPTDQIRRIHRIGHYQVVELNNPSRFVYDSRLPTQRYAETASILDLEKSVKLH